MSLVTGFTGSIGLMLISVLCASLVREIKSGTLARDGGFGLKTRKTKASDAAWNAGHRAASPYVRVTSYVALASAVLVIILCIALREDGDRGNNVTLIALGFGYVATVGMLVISARVADKAASSC